MKAKLRSLFIVLTLIASIHSALAQPTLNIAPAGNQVLLFWPDTATNYALQSTTNLVSPDWGPVADAVPLTVNNTITVTVTNTSSAIFFRLHNTNPPAGMALIPAGVFTMGNSIGDSDITDANPTNVTVSAFYMDTNLVSYSQWQSVYNWATTNGYGFDDAGSGKAANHPVQSVNWYDAVKWCNARSQQAGLTPVYFTDTGLTQVYTNGDTDAVYANWSANGYRLPTEAEWEKAARGGLSGQRFPWGNVISERLANYDGNTNLFSYDLGPNGYNPAFTKGEDPYTSPVGSFAPNGYGLYDMAGNVEEFCWDSYSSTYYSSSPGTDPRGPASSPDGYRVLRGGSWYYWASYSRCANRDDNGPAVGSYIYGFRCVKAH
jgi:formylglycine-generating enzyme required for sulfatase activity